MKRKILTGLGLLIIVVSVASLVQGAYKTGVIKRDTIVFSRNEMLLDMWNSYKKTYIEEGTGRSVNPQDENISTSESESYAMLRSVWMDDRETFDRTLAWAKTNLQRDDKLFSWRYGPTGNNTYGIQTSKGGQNTASDGDNDIALALLMAYSRWNETKYLDEAKPIIDAIWKYQVVSVAGKPILAANDLERNRKDKIIVNPSYFSPAAWRAFAVVDPGHDWNGLIDNSYTVLNASMKNKLDASKSAGLPPDWMQMNIQTGEITKAEGNQTTRYGYDAIRTSWRLGLDYMWNKDERAKKTLANMSFLKDQWNEKDKLAAVYAHDGSVVEDYETPAMYGTAMGYLTAVEPDLAKEIYDAKLKQLYNPDAQTAVSELSYYDSNWAWFGMAMEQDALPNLVKT